MFLGVFFVAFVKGKKDSNIEGKRRGMVGGEGWWVDEKVVGGGWRYNT